MYNVYEVYKDERYFITSLGSDKFTADVIFEHMKTDWNNMHHLTELIIIEE